MFTGRNYPSANQSCLKQSRRLVLPAAIVDDRSADLDEDDSAELRDEAASLLALIVSRSSPLSRSFVLASLRALHLDTGSGPAKSRAQGGKPQTMSAAGRCSGSGAINIWRCSAPLNSLGGGTTARVTTVRLSIGDPRQQNDTACDRRMSCGSRMGRRSQRDGDWGGAPSVDPCRCCARARPHTPPSTRCRARADAAIEASPRDSTRWPANRGDVRARPAARIATSLFRMACDLSRRAIPRSQGKFRHQWCKHIPSEARVRTVSCGFVSRWRGSHGTPKLERSTPSPGAPYWRHERVPPCQRQLRG